MTPASFPCVLRGPGGHSFIAFKAGRKWLHAVAMDQPIALVTLPLENNQLVPLERKGKPYPVPRAARMYLRSEIEKTDSARRVLRELTRRQPAGSES